MGQTIGNRSDAIVVSKFGHALDAPAKQLIGPNTDPEYIRQSVMDSKHRLKRDRVDVILAHINALPIQNAIPVSDTLEALGHERHIGGFGWSTDFPERLSPSAEHM